MNYVRPVLYTIKKGNPSVIINRKTLAIKVIEQIENK